MVRDVHCQGPDGSDGEDLTRAWPMKHKWRFSQGNHGVLPLKIDEHEHEHVTTFWRFLNGNLGPPQWFWPIRLNISTANVTCRLNHWTFDLESKTWTKDEDHFYEGFGYVSVSWGRTHFSFSSHARKILFPFGGIETISPGIGTSR